MLWGSNILCVEARLCFNGTIHTDLAVYNGDTCSTTTIIITSLHVNSVSHYQAHVI